MSCGSVTANTLIYIGDTMLNLLWVLGAIIDILRGVNNDDFV